MLVRGGEIPANGRNYYVLQAAYTATHACGEYKSPVEAAPQSGGNSSSSNSSGSVSQLIAPVKIASPDRRWKGFPCG